MIFKNVNYSISHKEIRPVIPKLREIKKTLPSTFIYDTILIKIIINANIMKRQIFISLVLPQRSLKVTFMFKTPPFVRYFFCLKSDSDLIKR